MNDHALAVDIAHLEPDQLGAAHPGAIKNHQERALEQAAAGVDQASDFFPAEDLGQLFPYPRERKELAELVPVQSANKEEP